MANNSRRPFFSVLFLLHIFLCFLGYRVTPSAVSCPPRTDHDGRCKMPCRSSSDCGSRRLCVCDGACGMSCVRKGMKCRNNYYDAPMNGRRIINGVKHGNTIEYKCKRGFKLHGPSVITCSGIRLWKPWDQGKPTCKRSCSDPGSPKDGRRNGDDFEVGRRVQFYCNPGYNLIGPSFATCGNNLKWNNIVPKCVVSSCPIPTIPRNARIRRGESQNYAYGARIFLGCQPGYTSNGFLMSVCLTDGWSKADLHCTPKSCGRPRRPINGVVKGNLHSYKNVITYECNPGYRLRGLKRRRCMQNQRWSGSSPICQSINCHSTPPLLNGKFVGYSTSYGAKKEAVCNNAFTLVGSKEITCGSNGWQFDGEKSACLDIQCHNPPRLVNGYFVGRSTNFGARKEARCNEGYILSGSITITCGRKGWEYDGRKSSCSDIQCHNPPRLVNGYFVGRSTNFGARKKARCNEGYILSGSKTITCGRKGWEYDGSKSSCKGSRCGKPPSIWKVEWLGADNSIGAYKKARCAVGYHITGSQYIKCSETGWRFEKEETKCIVFCRYISFPANGRGIYQMKEKDVPSVGSEVRFECDPGFKIQGSETIECRHDGSWSDKEPICIESEGGRIASCDNVPSLPNGKFSEDSGLVSTIGTRKSAQCDDGFELSGSRTITCYSNGWQYDGDKSKCEAITGKMCDNMPSIQNGRFVEDRSTNSATKNAVCNQGYKLSGSRTITCKWNVIRWKYEWRYEGEESKCEAITGTMCDHAPSLQNGKFEGSSTTKNAVCNQGFKLSGSSAITCKLNGRKYEWRYDGEESKCEGCPPPPKSANSRLQMVGENKVKYKCFRGFKRYGNKFLTCNRKEGTWEGDPPKCMDSRKCIFKAKAPLNATDNIVSHNHPQTFHCHDGYELTGPAIMLCRDGNLQGNLPTCTRSVFCKSCKPRKYRSLCSQHSTVFIAVVKEKHNQSADLRVKHLLKSNSRSSNYKSYTVNFSTDECNCQKLRKGEQYLFFTNLPVDSVNEVSSFLPIQFNSQLVLQILAANCRKA